MSCLRELRRRPVVRNGIVCVPGVWHQRPRGVGTLPKTAVSRACSALAIGAAGSPGRGTR